MSSPSTRSNARRMASHEGRIQLVWYRIDPMSRANSALVFAIVYSQCRPGALM